MGAAFHLRISRTVKISTVKAPTASFTMGEGRGGREGRREEKRPTWTKLSEWKLSRPKNVSPGFFKFLSMDPTRWLTKRRTRATWTTNGIANFFSLLTEQHEELARRTLRGFVEGSFANVLPSNAVFKRYYIFRWKYLPRAIHGVRQIQDWKIVRYLIKNKYHSISLRSICTIIYEILYGQF